MKIPDEIIENIKHTADIIEIVGEYVHLRRYGTNYKGLCPFHKERTPSFTVSQDKGIYKCFGCGKSGNIFSFLIDYHGMTFFEAVETIAKKYGIEIAKQNEDNFRQQSKKELALKAMETAANIFAKNLYSHEGKNALSYFVSRMLSNDNIKSFKLGYSSESWNDLMNVLYKEGYSEQTLLDAGLLIKNENGQSYDRFRGRAMFPIRDFLGRVIGFGARQLTNDADQAKYINSPQSLIYDKSKVLFGLSHSKNAIRDKGFAYLVEGYLDFLTLYQAGIENVVASSGTALTTEQLDLLARYSKSLYIVYDADSAGIKAADRAITNAIPKGFDCQVVMLPPGDDPDSIVRDRGKETFLTYVDKKINFVEFKYQIFKKDGTLNNPAGKAKIIREILALIVTIPDKLQHDFYISILSNLMQLKESQIQTIYSEKKKIQSEINVKNDEKIEKENDRQNIDQIVDPDEDIKVQDILKVLLPEESFIFKVLLNYNMKIDKRQDVVERLTQYMLTKEAKVLLEIIKPYIQSKEIIQDIFNDGNINQAYKDTVAHISLNEQSPSESWIKRQIAEELTIDFIRIIADSVNRLKLLKIESRIKEIQLQFTNTDEDVPLLQEITALSHEKNELTQKMLL